MRVLLVLLALAVTGLGFSTWTLSTVARERDPDQAPDAQPVAVPCELLPSGSNAWLLVDEKGRHMVEPAQRGRPSDSVPVVGDSRDAWVFVVLAEDRPEVGMVDQ